MKNKIALRATHRSFEITSSLKLVFLGGFLLGQTVFAGSAEVEHLKAISSFKEVNLDALAKGEVLTQRGGLTKLKRGISGESCFVTMKPSPATADYLQKSDPTLNNDDSVYFHRNVSNPVKVEDFGTMGLESKAGPVRRFVEKTLAMTAKETEFCLTRQEAAQMEKILSEAPKKERGTVETARRCWREILKVRAVQFQKTGLSQLMPYEMGDMVIHPTSEMRSLLEEVPQVSGEFAPLLAETGLGEASSAKSSQPLEYFELLNAQIKANFDLGAFYTKEMGNGRYQMLDCQYFSSGAYYVSLCLFELWPVKIGDKDATLVWRIDLLSAPLLEVTRGTSRMAWG